MDWQLPDIVKTITNTILLSSRSAYAVRSTYLEIQSFCRSAVVGYFRAFPIVSRYSHGYALMCAYEPRGARFKRLFQPNQPSKETTMQNYNYLEKHMPY